MTSANSRPRSNAATQRLDRRSTKPGIWQSPVTSTMASSVKICTRIPWRVAVTTRFECTVRMDASRLSDPPCLLAVNRAGQIGSTTSIHLRIFQQMWKYPEVFWDIQTPVITSSLCGAPWQLLVWTTRVRERMWSVPPTDWSVPPNQAKPARTIRSSSTVTVSYGAKAQTRCLIWKYCDLRSFFPHDCFICQSISYKYVCYFCASQNLQKWGKCAIICYFCESILAILKSSL